MSIEITIPTGTLRALSMFVSARAGTHDPNPNAAIHLRYESETCLRAACTNGSVIMYLRLYKESAQLTNFYFPEEEQEQTISVLPTRELLAALGSAGKSVTLSISTTNCTVRAAGETGITSHTVPRLYGRQISLFDDMDCVPAFTLDDLAPAGQFVVNPLVLGQMAMAAKRLGMPFHDLTIARFQGHTYGFQVGTDSTLWFTMRADVPVPAMTAGLPPEWVVGRVESPDVVDMDAVFCAVEEEEGKEQAELELGHGDEHGPAEVPTLDEAEDDGTAREVAEQTAADARDAEMPADAEPVVETFDDLPTMTEEPLFVDGEPIYLPPSRQHPIAQGATFTHPLWGECEQMKGTGHQAAFRVLYGEQAGRAYECSPERMAELRGEQPAA